MLTQVLSRIELREESEVMIDLSDAECGTLARHCEAIMPLLNDRWRTDITTETDSNGMVPMADRERTRIDSIAIAKR